MGVQTPRLRSDPQAGRGHMLWAPVNLTCADLELDPPEGKPGPGEPVGGRGRLCPRRAVLLRALGPAEGCSPRARGGPRGCLDLGASARLSRWACPARPPFSAESRVVTMLD